MKRLTWIVAALLALLLLVGCGGGKTDAKKTEDTPKQTTEPKKEETKTEAPKTEEPKKEEPKTEEPKTEEPKTEEPKADGTGESAALAAPVVTASAKKYGTIQLKWEAVDNAAKYVVYRRAMDKDGKAVGDWEKIATTKSLNFMDDTVTAKTEYAYRVRAIDENNEKSPSSETVKAKARVATIPYVQASAEAGGSAEVTLRAVKDVQQYCIYRRQYDQKAKAWSDWACIATTAELTFRDSGLTSGQKYGYYATAVGSDGTETEPSNTVSLTAK